MSLDDLVSVTIVADTTSPTKPGFGTILILASSVPTGFPANETVTYKSLTAMTADGFLTTSPAYVCASKIFSQKTRVKEIKVWKRSLPPVQTSTFQVSQPVVNEVFSLTVQSTDISYTHTGATGATGATAVATALAALISGVTGASGSASGDTITVTATGGTGVLLGFSDWSKDLAFTDTTADPGVATDLAACLVQDSDWYGLALDSNSRLEIKGAALWVEANKKLFVCNNSDKICKTSSSSDVMSELKALGYVRTAVLFNGNDTKSYAGAAWMGGRFPFDPGSYTWMFKQIATVAPDALTGGEQDYIEAKNGNTYTTVAGVNITGHGTTAAGEFIDITQFIDWLRAEIQIRVFGRLANLPKIPYTDLGVDIILTEILSALKKGVDVGGLDPGNGDDIPAPTATAPKVADIDPDDRAARLLPDVKFSARLAGAIHELDINGVLEV